MKIEQGDIYTIDCAAKKRNAGNILIGHVNVRVGEFVVKCNNFGMGTSYAKALNNLKQRCSNINDMSDVIDFEITDVDIDGKPFMGHGC